MLKTALMAMTMTVGLATAASAAIAVVPPAVADSGITQVGEGCGANRWRGPDGQCRPFNTPYGNRRGTPYECPPGWHIGPQGGRCWRN